MEFVTIITDGSGFLMDNLRYELEDANPLLPNFDSTFVEKCQGSRVHHPTRKSVICLLIKTPHASCVMVFISRN